MSRRLILLAAMGLLFVSCGLQDDPMTTVTGAVTDSATGLPIESASVWLDDSAHGEIMTTDSVGLYQWGGIGARPKTVTSSKQGHASKTKSVPGAGQSVRVDFELAPDSLN